MLVETDNLVSAEQFSKDVSKYAAAARKGRGPFALTVDSEVVGFFVSAKDYEALVGENIRRLLKSRQSGPTISQKEVRSRMREIIRRNTRKS
jgi:hypothetical protein